MSRSSNAAWIVGALIVAALAFALLRSGSVETDVHEVVNVSLLSPKDDGIGRIV